MEDGAKKQMSVLLLNSTYEPLRFINYFRAVKLLLKDKVDIIEEWGDDFVFNSVTQKIKMPAVVRIKKYVNVSRFKQIKFSKNALYHRDNWMCQYCGKKLIGKELTMDHIIPRSKGGRTDWTNCATCCIPCNIKKGNKSLSESGLTLLKKAQTPTHFEIITGHKNKYVIHESWKKFFKDF